MKAKKLIEAFILIVLNLLNKSKINLYAGNNNDVYYGSYTYTNGLYILDLKRLRFNINF
jgi:hypothetical protein